MIIRPFTLSCILLCSFLPRTYSQHHKSLCAQEDSRLPSDDHRIGRLFSEENKTQCTVSLISKNCIITAGHCYNFLYGAEFRTSVSTNGETSPSLPEDRYLIDFEAENGRRWSRLGHQGHDWKVMRLKANEKTKKYPGEVYGYFRVNLDYTPNLGDMLVITGYGRDDGDPSRHRSQQSAEGELTLVDHSLVNAIVPKGRLTLMGHRVDTRGGSSGSAIRLKSDDSVIGIHTHGGCSLSSPDSQNFGTFIKNSPLLVQAIQECVENQVEEEAELN